MLGAKVLRRIPLPDLDGVVVLYDWMADEVRDGRNLVFEDTSGAIRWRAELPLGQGAQDCFVSVDWMGGSLKASSWSGFRVTLDPASGRTQEQVFTK